MESIIIVGDLMTDIIMLIYRVLYLSKPLVKVSDIVYAESDSRYSMIYLESGEKVIVSRTLKHYHELLNDFGF